MSIDKSYNSPFVNQESIDLDLMPTDWSGTAVNDASPVFISNQQVVKHYKTLGLYDGPIPTFQGWLEMAHRCTSAVDNYVIWGLNVDLEEANSLYKRFYEEARKRFEPVPYKGVRETLQWLNDDRAKVLGVISAHPSEALTVEVKQFGFDKYFQFIEGSVHDKAKRFTELVESLDLDPQRVGYPCDMPNDLKACLSANIVPLVHPRGYAPEKILDVTLREFEDNGFPYRKFYEWPELRRIVI